MLWLVILVHMGSINMWKSAIMSGCIPGKLKKKLFPENFEQDDIVCFMRLRVWLASARQIVFSHHFSNNEKPYLFLLKIPNQSWGDLWSSIQWTPYVYRRYSTWVTLLHIYQGKTVLFNLYPVNRIPLTPVRWVPAGNMDVAQIWNKFHILLESLRRVLEVR